MTKVKNLAQLKRAIGEKKRFRVVEHWKHPECVGEIRKPNILKTTCFTTVIDGDPDHKVSMANGGIGYWMWYGKANMWDFDEEYITALTAKGTPIMTIRFVD